MLLVCSSSVCSTCALPFWAWYSMWVVHLFLQGSWTIKVGLYLYPVSLTVPGIGSPWARVWTLLLPFERVARISHCSSPDFTGHLDVFWNIKESGFSLLLGLISTFYYFYFYFYIYSQCKDFPQPRGGKKTAKLASSFFRDSRLAVVFSYLLWSLGPALLLTVVSLLTSRFKLS